MIYVLITETCCRGCSCLLRPLVAEVLKGISQFVARIRAPTLPHTLGPPCLCRKSFSMTQCGGRKRRRRRLSLSLLMLFAEKRKLQTWYVLICRRNGKVFLLIIVFNESIFNRSSPRSASAFFVPSTRLCFDNENLMYLLEAQAWVHEKLSAKITENLVQTISCFEQTFCRVIPCNLRSTER